MFPKRSIQPMVTGDRALAKQRGVHDRSCRTLTSDDEQGKSQTGSQAASAAFPEGRIGPPFYGGFGNVDQILTKGAIARFNGLTVGVAYDCSPT